MSRRGACSCRSVEFTLGGPVRDVIVCHCNACKAAAGGPWRASAVRRAHLEVADESALRWERAAVSAYEASRAFCRSCGAYVFWDAPGRPTVSFGATLLEDEGHDLVVAAHIWVPEEDRAALARAGVTVERAGLPAGVEIAWHE